jgi:hypothetical protein
MAKTKAKVTKTVQNAAKALIKLFGPKGEHWLTGSETDDDGNYCLIGGLKELNYKKNLFDPLVPLQASPNDEHIDYDSDYKDIRFSDTPEFNDRDGFAPVQTFLKLLAKGINPADAYIDKKGRAEKVIITKKVIKLK